MNINAISTDIQPYCGEAKIMCQNGCCKIPKAVVILADVDTRELMAVMSLEAAKKLHAMLPDAIDRAVAGDYLPMEYDQ